MKDREQLTSDQREKPYEPPRLTVLGTLAELTRGTQADGPDDDLVHSDPV